MQDIRSKIGLVEADENKARKAFLSRSEKLAADTLAAGRKRETQVKRRLAELERLIATVYEDKVLGKIPEEVCINLLSKYQEEKKNLTIELSEIERRLHNEVERHADVDEFIRRLKSYIGVPELTREMCMELIEFVTVDECPGKYSKEPREIHIYYKLIDKNQSKPTHKM